MSKEPWPLVALVVKALSVVKKSLAYPACARVTICSQKQALYPIYHSAVMPPPTAERQNKRFRVLAAKVKRSPYLLIVSFHAPLIASVQLLQPVQHGHYPQVIVRSANQFMATRNLFLLSAYLEMR